MKEMEDLVEKMKRLQTLNPIKFESRDRILLDKYVDDLAYVKRHLKSGEAWDQE